jgi:hypothetical protein
MKPKYINIDFEALSELWRTRYSIKKDDFKTLVGVWDHLFHTSKPETYAKHFSFSFSTDGVGCSIQCKRQKREEPIESVIEVPTKEQIEGKTIIGVDEGRHYLWIIFLL